MFCAIPVDFNFSYFYFSLVSDIQKCFMVISPFLRKSNLKTCVALTKPGSFASASALLCTLALLLQFFYLMSFTCSPMIWCPASLSPDRCERQMRHPERSLPPRAYPATSLLSWMYPLVGSKWYFEESARRACKYECWYE